MLKTSNNFQISSFFFEKWKEQLKRFEGENQRQNQFDISICPGMILLIPVDASLFISGIMGEDKQ